MDDLLNNAPCGYVSFTDDGIIKRCNHTLAALLEYDEGELTGKKFESLFNIAGKIFFQTHFFPLVKMQNRADEIFFSLVTKSGKPVPVITNTVRQPENGEAVNNCILVPVLQRRKYEDEILKAKRLAEETLQDNRDLIKARLDLESHSRELDRRLSKINQFTHEWLEFHKVMNHDMQECIRKILLFSGLALRKNSGSDLEKVLISAERLKSITRNLESYITLGLHGEDFSEVDLNEVVSESITAVRNDTRFTGMQVEMSDLPVIRGSFHQLKELFRQLLDNSVKFRKGDSLNVSIDHVIYESNLYRNSREKYDYGSVLRITVKDDGTGFDNAYKEYVFQILKKLDKDGGPGLGFGLSICKKVVDNHLGEISISSEPGLGTAVSIILPIH